MRKLLAILFGCFCIFSTVVSYAATPKTWTFLIFMNGNNNLDRFSEANLIDMEKVGSNDQVNIVVQWASMSRPKVMRLLVQKSADSSIKKVTSPIIEELDADMGDVNSLNSFIEWGVKNFPADHYFIDVWNHGSGWHLKKQADIHKFDISWDEKTGHHMTTEQLGQAMVHASEVMGHKVDLYGSDACLMAMPEVASEMASGVSFYVGSEETEPGDGWPYDRLLATWQAIPNASAQDVAKTLVKEYLGYYREKGYDDVTMSAFDLSKLPAFDTAITAFGKQLSQLNAKDRAKVLNASKATQRFAYDDYADLLDFTDKISALKLKSLKAVTKDVKSASKELLIASDSGYKNAYGVSMWIPYDSWTYNEYADRYKAMQFNVATEWSDALAALLQA